VGVRSVEPFPSFDDSGHYDLMDLQQSQLAAGVLVCVRVSQGAAPGGPCTNSSRVESEETVAMLVRTNQSETCPVCGRFTRILQLG
jgi:hypothetical protein